MLINLRNALMAGKRLPYDAEVEYLESTGTQYINTGVKPGPNTRVETVFAMTTFTANCGLFGARGNATADNNSYNLFIISNSGARVRWDWSGSGQYQTTEAETSTDATYILGAAGGDITRNGTTVMSVSASKAAINYPLYVFNFNNVGTPYSTGANARFWSVKIYEGQTLVFDAIPVRKKTVGYLYDRVSGKLFGNAGTGDFVLGQDVVPVEWLQTDGAAYIDTGLEMADGHEVRAEHYFKRSTTRQLMGSNASRQYYGVSADGYVEFGLLGTSKSTVSVDEAKKYLITYAASEGNNTGSIYEGDTLLWSSSGAYYGFTNSFKIFRLSTNGSLAFVAGNKIVSFKHIASGETKQSLLSVRVGTGSTWEGAMMDTLTRRIYRNAGTGAFTYGNDLKYPIPAS